MNPASEPSPVAPWILAGVFTVAGLLALCASIAGWDWFFSTRSAKALGGNNRNRGRIIYGFLGIIMIAAAISLIL